MAPAAAQKSSIHHRDLLLFLLSLTIKIVLPYDNISQPHRSYNSSSRGFSYSMCTQRCTFFSTPLLSPCSFLLLFLLLPSLVHLIRSHSILFHLFHVSSSQQENIQHKMCNNSRWMYITTSLASLSHLARLTSTYITRKKKRKKWIKIKIFATISVFWKKYKISYFLMNVNTSHISFLFVWRCSKKNFPLILKEWMTSSSINVFFW